MMYTVPAVFAVLLATSNYMQQAFGVYLKYQAMVDSYYMRQKGADSLSFIVDEDPLANSDLTGSIQMAEKDIA